LRGRGRRRSPPRGPAGRTRPPQREDQLQGARALARQGPGAVGGRQEGGRGAGSVDSALGEPGAEGGRARRGGGGAGRGGGGGGVPGVGPGPPQREDQRQGARALARQGPGAVGGRQEGGRGAGSVDSALGEPGAEGGRARRGGGGADRRGGRAGCEAGEG